jgi:hypothetical protein
VQRVEAKVPQTAAKMFQLHTPPPKATLQQPAARIRHGDFELTRTFEREGKASFLHGAAVTQREMQTGQPHSAPLTGHTLLSCVNSGRRCMRTSTRTVSGALSLPFSTVRTLRSFCCTRSNWLPVRLLIFVGSPPINLAVILPVAARVQACAAMPVPHPAPGCSPSRRL